MYMYVANMCTYTVYVYMYMLATYINMYTC